MIALVWVVSPGLVLFGMGNHLLKSDPNAANELRLSICRNGDFSHHVGGWPFAVGLQFIGRAPVTWVVTDHIHGDSLILGVA